MFRTERRRNPKTGASYPWLVRSTAMVNQFYFYAIDRDFGPFFLKFCTYFPYNAKLCINGHEYVKRQLTRRGIDFEALDNGILSCDDPARCRSSATSCRPRRSTPCCASGCAGCRIPSTPRTVPGLSLRHLDSASGVLADPGARPAADGPRLLRGGDPREPRHRPSRPGAADLRAHACTARARPTPGRFRTRVITEGVDPSLHVDYKTSRIKQYHKEGRALRTETTINNTTRLRHRQAAAQPARSAGGRLPEPTDVYSTSNASATTARWAKMPFTASNALAAWPISERRLFASTIRASKLCSTRWSTSDCSPPASPTPISVVGWVPFSVADSHRAA